MIWRIAHPAGLLPLGTAPPRRYAAMCDGPIAIRVCTYGGEGRCSGGDGEAARAAVRVGVRVRTDEGGLGWGWG